MPVMVTKLCNGLLMISASFCMRNLSIVFDEIEALILKETNSSHNFEAHSMQRAFLRDIKREREGIAPVFMQLLEQRIASIRSPDVKSQPNKVSSFTVNIANLGLVNHEHFEKKQLFSNIVARYEAQNNSQIYTLRQRFAVLSGKPPFSSSELPLGPNALCECLLDAIEPLNINLENTQVIAKIFEGRLLSNFDELLGACNQFLIEHKILSHLNYTAYRNPELRNKKSAIALKNKELPPVAGTQSSAQDTSNSAEPQTGPTNPQSAAVNVQAPAVPQQRRFNDFRNLLSAKKQQLSVLDGMPESGIAEVNSESVSASAEILNEILSKITFAKTSSHSFTDGVQSIKNQIQSQLSSRSSNGHDLKLTSEDSDAIDMIGILLDSAVKNLKSGSTTSELLAMLQAPMISVALKDKTFFDNSAHPARKMLDTLAETGVNWLDVKDRDEKLYGSVVEIVTNFSKNPNIDNKSIQTGYEKTDLLLQTLIKKAEAIERRQIEIAKGKERLGIARMHAEECIDQLIEGRDLTEYTKSTMLNAWTDALVLTELRHGYESSNWQSMKESAQKIINKDDNENSGKDTQAKQELTTHIQESLQLVGYQVDESKVAAERLLKDTAVDAQQQPATPERLINSERNNRENPVYKLNAQQKEYLKQIKSLPFGTWFEFFSKETFQTDRRKMAWASHTTHHILFVNARGQKIDEMQMEELAINLSLGIVSIPKVDTRSFIERAFDTAYNTLKELLPNQAKDAK